MQETRFFQVKYGCRLPTGNEERYLLKKMSASRVVSVLLASMVALFMAVFFGLGVALFFLQNKPWPIYIMIVVLVLCSGLLFLALRMAVDNFVRGKKPLLSIRMITGTLNVEVIHGKYAHINYYLGKTDIDFPRHHWSAYFTKGNNYTVEAAYIGGKDALGPILLKAHDGLSIDKEVPLGLLKTHSCGLLLVTCFLLFLFGLGAWGFFDLNPLLSPHAARDYLKTNYRQQHEFSSVESILKAGLPVNRTVTLTNVYLIDDILADTSSSYKAGFYEYIDSALCRIRLLRRFLVEKKPLAAREKDSLAHLNPDFDLLLKRHDPKFRKEHPDLLQIFSDAAARLQMSDKKQDPEFLKKHEDILKIFSRAAACRKTLDTIPDEELIRSSIQIEAGQLKSRVETYTNSIVERPCAIACNYPKKQVELSIDTACLEGIDDIIDRVRQSSSAFATWAFRPRTVTGRIFKGDGEWVRIDCNPEAMYEPRALLVSMCVFGGGLFTLIIMVITGIFWLVRSSIIFKRIREYNAWVEILPEKDL